MCRNHVLLTPDGRGRILADGTVMPLLGLGVWQVPDGPTCVHAVRAALELGYRHIDTAQAYGNESSVGRALRESGIARDEVFITTKFHPGRRDPLREAAYSIEQLGVDYVDLYLVHWPGGGATWAWPGMEAARTRSYARAIGVSNFDAGEIDQLIAGATVAPAVDQVQFNPRPIARRSFTPATSVTSRWRPTAHWAPAPCSRTRRSTDIAARVKRSPAQVLLRWCVQRGIPVITKAPIATASPRTRRSSTSSCPPRTWRRSTPSIGQEGPAPRSSASGGEAHPADGVR